jgi:hypothetical protein
MLAPPTRWCGAGDGTRGSTASTEPDCQDQDVATLAERILEAIRYAALDDDVLAKRLGVSQRQAVNQAARRLEQQGKLKRVVGPDGKIVNALVDHQANSGPPAAALRVTSSRPGTPISEDEVEGAVRDHLGAHGFDVQVAWGRVRGIDIEANHPDGRRYVIEAKAETGTSGAQQVNYFLGMLGELLQRMSDPEAVYGIALPDNGQYRGLVQRLPPLARERLGLVVFWVARQDDGLAVTVERDF